MEIGRFRETASSPVAKGRKPKYPPRNLIDDAVGMLRAGYTPSDVENAWSRAGFNASKRTRQYYISDIQQALAAGVEGNREDVNALPGSPNSTPSRKKNAVFTYVVEKFGILDYSHIDALAEPTNPPTTRQTWPSSQLLDLHYPIAEPSYRVARGGTATFPYALQPAPFVNMPHVDGAIPWHRPPTPQPTSKLRRSAERRPLRMYHDDNIKDESDMFNREAEMSRNRLRGVEVEVEISPGSFSVLADSNPTSTYRMVEDVAIFTGALGHSTPNSIGQNVRFRTSSQSSCTTNGTASSPTGFPNQDHFSWHSPTSYTVTPGSCRDSVQSLRQDSSISSSDSLASSYCFVVPGFHSPLLDQRCLDLGRSHMQAYNISPANVALRLDQSERFSGSPHHMQFPPATNQPDGRPYRTNQDLDHAFETNNVDSLTMSVHANHNAYGNRDFINQTHNTTMAGHQSSKSDILQHHKDRDTGSGSSSTMHASGLTEQLPFSHEAALWEGTTTQMNFEHGPQWTITHADSAVPAQQYADNWTPRQKAQSVWMRHYYPAGMEAMASCMRNEAQH